MRAHFVNENVGGHATVHIALREQLGGLGVAATFFDVPPPSGWRRVAGARVPPLDRLDADLQPLRIQLLASAVVRRHLPDAPSHDVLHVYTHNVALLSAQHLAARPSVVTLDATNRQNAYRLPQRRPTRVTPIALVPAERLERRVYDAATVIVAQSGWAARSLVEDYGVADAKVRVIPLGITLPPQLPRADDGGPPRITFVGRSMDRKGGWRLLEVWRRHLRSRSRLTLVTLDAVDPEPGLEVRNDVRPGDGQLESLLARTAVFAFPTELDTFGMAAIEAMAAAVPVVATATAALPEIVAHGETGLLVAEGDDEMLRDALERLLDDEALRRQMGAAGRARAEKHFDAKVTTTALVGVLREAIAVRNA